MRTLGVSGSRETAGKSWISKIGWEGFGDIRERRGRGEGESLPYGDSERQLF